MEENSSTVVAVSAGTGSSEVSQQERGEERIARDLLAAHETNAFLLKALESLGIECTDGGLCFDRCAAHGLHRHSPACQSARAALSKATPGMPNTRETEEDQKPMPTTTYYYDANLQAHVIERVDPQDDGLCEKALFYGPNARHMAWAFGRHYYDSSVGALTSKEQAAADDAGEQGSARSGEEPPSSPSRERVEVLEEALREADSALTEAEAILGGEYGDHYGVLCERMIKLRATIAALKAPSDG